MFLNFKMWYAFEVCVAFECVEATWNKKQGESTVFAGN